MNKNNKNRKEKEKTKSKFNVKTILTSRGFYITLATLIIVFGTAAVVRKFTADIKVGESSFDDEAWNLAVAEAEKELAEEVPDEVEIPEVKIPQDEFPEITEPQTVPVSKELTDEEIVASLNMSLPCKGDIAKKHSPDSLVFFKTTDDWRTHEGIDIAADRGTVISAAADGVVEEVYEDDRLGIVVVIGHEGKIRTLYANLADKDFIEVGRKVAKGDAIGAIGDTSVLEGKDKSHLHFEVIKNGESQNPSLYIPL